METTKFIAKTIDENALFDGALEILKEVRPTWKADCITFNLLTDGITNKLVKCSLNEAEHILIRIYGPKTDLLIDRRAEINNFQRLHQLDLAPALYATFSNGLVYEFVPGCTLDANTVIIPEIYSLVARHMAKLHQQIHVTGDPMLWRKLNHFLELVPDKFHNPSIQNEFIRFGRTKCDLKNEIVSLKSHLDRVQSPIVFAHNDLLLGNVVYTKERNVVTFIDYEYADYNYQAFDIGDHFAEFVGLDNSTYEKYPSKEFQCKWLREYLLAMNGTVSECDIERLYVQVNQFALATHLFWGLWALIQAEHSTIDFDFVGYASRRLNEYFAKKNVFLSLKLPS